MKIWVGVTDDDWFSFLRELTPDEVNFWQPSGSRQFKLLQPGEPFLFKLHSPRNFIVGGGFFVRHTALPCSLAWSAFGVKNGVADAGAFRARIRRYRRDAEPGPDPTVGCNILTEPFFWREDEWIQVPTGRRTSSKARATTTRRPRVVRSGRRCSHASRSTRGSARSRTARRDTAGTISREFDSGRARSACS